MNHRKLDKDILKHEDLETYPRMTLIFTAKDEESELPATLNALEKIEYPGLEIIAIDDRSVDRTGSILSQWKSRHKFKKIEITKLEPGWLGKTHALHFGAKESGGEWLLFTDADVIFQPNSLKKAVEYAENNKLDFLSLAPHINSPSKVTQLTLEFFNAFFVLFMQPWKSGERKGKPIGVGAFNLIRRSCYQKIGGHEAVRLNLDDDLKLAAKTKAAEGKLGSLNGTREIEIKFYNSFQEMIRGFEKNVIQAFQFSLLRALIALTFTYLVLISPIALLFLTKWSIIPLALFIITLIKINHQFGYAKRNVCFYPLGLHLYFWILVRSCMLAFLRNEIRWRGQSVSLNNLRKFSRLKDPPQHA